MNAFRHGFPLCALLALCLPAAMAANHDVLVVSNSFSPEELTVQLGDTVTFRNSGGGLHNAVSDPGAPVAFRCANGCSGQGGNGSPSAGNWTAVVTMDAAGLTRYFCEIHGGAGGTGMSGSIFVVGAAAPAPAARDDLVRLRIGDGPSDVAVLANDVVDGAALAGGNLTIVQAPAVGTASVQGGANAGTPADDTIRYTLPAGVAVDTTVGYRICDGTDRCDEGQLRILARALHDDDLARSVDADAGFFDVDLGGLPALPGARFETTALVVPVEAQQSVPVDATPATPWDADRAGTTTFLGTLAAPADGLPQAWSVTVDARPATAGDIDLFVGPDLDGDSTPDESELRCTSAMTTGTERCELRLDHPGTGTLRYWAMAQNRGAGTVTVHTEIAPLALRADGAPELVATGPGSLPAGAASMLRVGWDQATWLPGGIRFGLLRVRPTPGSDLGWVPVRLQHDGGEPVARALASGEDLRLRLSNTGVHERVYVDVPPGATRLTVTSTASANVDLYLAHVDSPAFPAVAAAPPRGSAIASSTGPSGNETMQIEPPVLVPGRWYVTPVNAGAIESDVVLRATVQADAPVVRSGSYFNPDRSGHGMFVYPAGAGAVWTVLWYHYFEDGSPTWYYLEGAAPGANGVFTSGVYRSAWDGDSNFLVQVGEATLTPTGPDAFAWSFTLDGRSGSEPMAALGRDCPSVDGIERDASSTWFDVAKAGTGYSVQLFPNATGAGYEYTAAFVYDGHGRPRYLAAELPSAGPATQTYALEQLTGFCPLCPRTAAPARQDIGTFRRTYVGGDLSRVEVDAIYADGIPGAWTGDDMVQPLGGEDAVQGCDP